MLTLKLLRDDPEYVIRKLAVKNFDARTIVEDIIRLDANRRSMQAESDALIVKGIVALLIRVLNDSTPKEILDADLYFIEEIGLKEHLSPTRSNGLLAMVKQMKVYALAYKNL